MKKVEVVKRTQIEAGDFYLQHFIQSEENSATISKTVKKVSKKELKRLADSLGLPYEEKQIAFAKKLFNAYLIQMSEI